jgi:L-threonylcarbamoyladenylate synthase
VQRELGDAVDLIIDGGPRRAGQESTVVDITTDALKMLREGAISRREIERVLGQEVEV